MGRPKLDETRRKEILDAFERCVVRDGLAKTTLKNVSDEAGLPRPLIRHFVGNRDDMIDLLIERVVDRANQFVLKYVGTQKRPSVHEYLDFMFGNAFKDETTNEVVDQLWGLARTDDNVREKLADMYRRHTDVLVSQMKAERMGKSHQRRSATAQVLLALAYGEASFDWLGLEVGNKQATRKVADLVISQLTNET